VCLRVLPSSHQEEEVSLSEQDTTLTDDQIRGESTFGDTPETGTEIPGTGTETEEGDSDGMDTGGGSDSDDSDSDSDGSDS
jgi:hypothetical protein